MKSFPFRLSQLKSEGTLQGAKWITFRILIEKWEMADLLKCCLPIFLCNVSELVSEETVLITEKSFLDNYGQYIACLRQGMYPDRDLMHPFFSSLWTRAKKSLCAFPVSEDKYILKPIEPSVQLNAHTFSFSPINNSFHSMVHSRDVIPWGIQFSYPQVYSLSKGGEVKMTRKENNLFNNELFSCLKKWIRTHTKPVRFFRGKERLTATFRASNSCIKWMAAYPAIKQLGLEM